MHKGQGANKVMPELDCHLLLTLLLNLLRSISGMKGFPCKELSRTTESEPQQEGFRVTDRQHLKIRTKDTARAILA